MTKNMNVNLAIDEISYSLQAGINPSQLTLALEPEAASIYCQHMHLINTNGPSNVDDTFKKIVEEGKKYMVVDLGGWF